MKTVLACSFLVFISILGLIRGESTEYFIGSGIHDITGPAADVNMMGYANPSQTAKGIHFRQRSRAFIIHDKQNKSRIVFVSIDACMVDQIVKLEVVKKLKARFGKLYTEENVCISGIHTHSGPGGFLQYVLFDITSLGFINQTLFAYVDGIVESIAKAHADIKPGNIFVNQGQLLNSNINRSPSAYLFNPPKERAKYKYDVDKEMVLLKMADAKGHGIGMVNWFAVHGTSMNNTNELVSGDNKGYASYLFEKEMNGKSTLPGKGSFVAAFAQSNEGDVSPNTRGPFCIDSGKPCNKNHSTCNGDDTKCIGRGPGANMFESTEIIGRNQFSKAKELYDGAKKKVTGPVDFRHMYVDMTNVAVTLKNGTKVHTCKPAMGFSFAAGTTDGPGMFGFQQGYTTGNEFWNLIVKFLEKPSKEQIACQHPKPILLDTGEIKFPYRWQPFIVDLQVLRIGNFVIVAVPGEFTTMSGRRVRDAVHKVVDAHFGNDTTVVIAGLSNTYADYIATYEEYHAQRYEGASTIYGPHTLQAYISKFVELSQALVKGKAVKPGPTPPNLLKKQLSFVPGVVFDSAPIGKKFGQVKQDVKSKYKVNETVEVIFYSADPRNNLMTEGTFLTVETQDKHGKWHVRLTDGDWDTRFYWHKPFILDPSSTAKITWTISPDTPAGTYRIQHFGHSKGLLGDKQPFHGTSSSFKVTTN
ncbi:Neutral ceramidase [Trichoplax sp. H2]|nr:Neutral ceramidase [Trichoplax sp. H2]|eukprot:RDD40045.1 Neutral ceramidase [Trichoplax sp. H2]